MNEWERLEREAAAQAFERAAAAIRSGTVQGAEASWRVGAPIDVSVILTAPLEFISINLVVDTAEGPAPDLPAPMEGSNE